MSYELKIKEITPVNIEGGFMINGFPSTGISSAIATESIINTSEFQMSAIIDSDSFPPISVIKNGQPNYPTRIFTNKDLNTAIFSSYLTLDASMHKSAAKMMLKWAKEKKCSAIISCITMNTDSKEIFGVASTGTARGKLIDAKIDMVEHGTIPGISGVLLNEGMLNGQDVMVLVVSSNSRGPDFRASSRLCDGLSKIIPGISYNADKLEIEAKQIEEQMQQVEHDRKDLADNIYG